MNMLATPDQPFRHADLDGRRRAKSISPLPRSGGTTPRPFGGGAPGEYRRSRGGGETTVIDCLDGAVDDAPGTRATRVLRKAWLCDDAGDVERARLEREEAAWYLRMAIREGSPVNGHVSADLALLADLLRRSGDCQGAIAVALRGLAVGAPEGVGALLLFQLELARAGDENCHDIGEALAASA
jgi:hypothetical protein